MKGGLALSGLVTLTVLVWGAFLFLLPDTVGEELLGDSWTGTRAVLLASVIGAAGSALAVGPGTLLLAMDRAKVTIRVHAVLAVLVLGLGVGGVFLGGANGAAWGFALAFWAVVPAWWVLLHREARGTVLRETAAAVR